MNSNVRVAMEKKNKQVSQQSVLLTLPAYTQVLC